MVVPPIGDGLAEMERTNLEANRRSAVHGRDKASSRQDYASPPARGRMAAHSSVAVSGAFKPQKFITVPRQSKGRFAMSRSGAMQSTMNCTSVTPISPSHN